MINVLKESTDRQLNEIKEIADELNTKRNYET